MKDELKTKSNDSFLFRIQNILLSPWPVILISFVVSLIIAGSYGIAWDEPMQKQFGENAWSYIFGDRTQEYIENFGPAYELFLTGVQKALRLTDSRDIFIMRHLVNHWIFLLALFCFYRIVILIFKKKLIALSAMVFMLLSPRIYAHSFFNSKDILYMCLSVFSFYFLLTYLRNNKVLFLILSGILCGIMVNIRMSGIVNAGLLIMLLALLRWHRKDRIVRLIWETLLVIVCSVLTLYLTWPFIWHDTFTNLRSFFEVSMNYFWDYQVLYRGKFYPGTQLPWHYLPTWIFISVPLNYLLLFLTGTTAFIIYFLKSGFREEINILLLYVFLSVMMPGSLVFILGSTVYDDWRHLYFIYPFMLILAAAGFDFLLRQKQKIFRYISFLLALFSLITMGWMVHNHPFQSVYLNQLVPRSTDYVRFHYEQDYWGACFKQGFEYILKHDTAQVIKIVVTKLPGELNHMILKPADRKRIRYVQDFRKADYFVTHYRVENYDFPDLGKPWYFISVNNSRILAIWKFKDDR